MEIRKKNVRVNVLVVCSSSRHTEDAVCGLCGTRSFIRNDSPAAGRFRPTWLLQHEDRLQPHRVPAVRRSAMRESWSLSPHSPNPSLKPMLMLWDAQMRWTFLCQHLSSDGVCVLSSVISRKKETTPNTSFQNRGPFIKCLNLSLCLSDESMQKCFAEGSGPVYQDILSWLQSSNTQLQLSGALAIANFARNGETFVWTEAHLRPKPRLQQLWQ